MKYIPLYNPQVLQKIIDDCIAEDPDYFIIEGEYERKPKLIIPVTDIEIDHYNFGIMGYLVGGVEEFDPLWDDFLNRGGDEKIFLKESLKLIGAYSELERGLLQALANLDNSPKLSGGQIVSKHINEIENASYGEQKGIFSKLAKDNKATPNAIKQALQRYRKK